MTSQFSVYQHWDPLSVCVVGRSYPPEFYAWIKVPKVRKLFETIAEETEEDYQNIIKTLEKFGVEVLRPDLPRNTWINGKFLPPPMTPRDYMVMIGADFYKGYSLDIEKFYNSVKDPSWPSCSSLDDIKLLPPHIKDECFDVHGLQSYIDFYSSYDKIFERIQSQGNTIRNPLGDFSNGAYVTRLGEDLYFGTNAHQKNLIEFQHILDHHFPDTRNHIVDTQGHSDGTYCPICPGLIVSLYDIPTYEQSFPGWEVIYLPNQSWNLIPEFLRLKSKNQGRWWIPGFEDDDDVVNLVETWLDTWVGYVEETVFDVNMLIIDPKNVMVFNYNKLVFDALNKYGITAHIVPFRHRYFWDGGIHCVTTDLHRIGHRQNFFPQRNIK